MKPILVVCLLFVCVYSTPTFDVKLDAPWALYKQTFEKQYDSTEEIYRRFVWEDNIDFIRKHNLEADLGLHSYTLGMNKYGDLTNEEFNKQMNTFDLSLTNQTYDFHHGTFEAAADVQLPNSVDWTQKGYVTEVKDQGQCGSCWAFSATGAVEGQHFAKSGELVSLSEQNLVDCSSTYGNHGCKGGLMDNAFRYIKENGGIDTEESYPYQAIDGPCRFNPKTVGAKITGYVDVTARSEASLQAAIAKIGPISVAIDASKRSFQLYSDGVYNERACSASELNHGVLAVGYSKKGGQDCYIVKNSWGPSWGKDGYILMSRNKRNQCGIATMASYPTV